eukprot:TRINITY_DN11797_c0_g1_i2.p1 TRINITY_DN11797_c0_g1~~TRINITY_DN11797_c0_g1_i2.p1  ORF type:complete len:279 (+),score=58.83 TRINITY_DN11797_c0_g1_i2:252-1088(+)
MSGAELLPSEYVNAYSTQQSRHFISGVLKKMEKMESRNKFAEALDYCETQILYCTDVYGEHSPHTWKLCERFAATSNALAVAAVQQGSTDQPTQLLRRALALLRRCGGRTRSDQLLVSVVTLNNLGTHYRRIGKLKASYSCLVKAVGFNHSIEDLAQCADSHVNLCSTLSVMKRHSQAAEQASMAIRLLRKETGELEESMGADPGLQAQWQQRSGVMAVAIYNHGVELEALTLDQAALSAYKEATRVCNKCFGPDHPTSVAMAESYHSALQSMTVLKL